MDKTIPKAASATFRAKAPAFMDALMVQGRAMILRRVTLTVVAVGTLVATMLALGAGAWLAR